MVSLYYCTLKSSYHEPNIYHYLAADADYRTTTITVTFMPSGVSQRLCGNVPIIDDTTAGEPNEEFSVTLVSSDPPGVRFGDRESCITIIDNDGEQPICHSIIMFQLRTSVLVYKVFSTLRTVKDT